MVNMITLGKTWQAPVVTIVLSTHLQNQAIITIWLIINCNFSSRKTNTKLITMKFQNKIKIKRSHLSTMTKIIQNLNQNLTMLTSSRFINPINIKGHQKISSEKKINPQADRLLLVQDKRQHWMNQNKRVFPK